MIMEIRRAASLSNQPRKTILLSICIPRNADCKHRVRLCAMYFTQLDMFILSYFTVVMVAL